jgi:hypothetical protein
MQKCLKNCILSSRICSNLCCINGIYLNYCQVYGVTTVGVSICNRIYWLSQLVTTRNYSAVAISHILQFITTRIWSPNFVLFFPCDDSLSTLHPDLWIELSILESGLIWIATGSRLWDQSQSQSHVTTDGQYILVSSSLWNLWPDITFCLKVAVLSLWGALSDEMSSLSLVSHCQQYLDNCPNLISFTFYMSYMFYVYTVYTRPLSAQAQYSRHGPLIKHFSSLSYHVAIARISQKIISSIA